jgi:1A family penicillin-binding protein
MTRAIKRLLSTLGKPFYFLLAGLVLLPIIAINKIGSIRLKRAHRLKPKKGKRVRKTKPAITLLPKIKLPKVSFSLRLEKLRLNLLFVKLSDSAKRFLTKTFKKQGKRRAHYKIWPLFTVLIIIFSAVFAFYFFIIKDMPSVKELESRAPQVSTKIYDRNGNLLYKIYKDENRTIIPLAQIPEVVRLSTLAAEDAEFYSHPGFSIRGIFRAIIQDTKNGSIQGGSTITQQLVKNTLLTPEKTITRKIREIILSVEIETIYSKDQIFEMYLNQVSYGGTAYGIEEASESYFGKSVKDLDLAEAALLAGLPKSPTTYSPFGSNPELAFERQREVLHLMVVNKYITEAQAVSAAQEKLHFISRKTEIKAPHFVMYIRQLLVDKYGEDMVEKGGLEVTTSLDLPTQEIAEQVVKSEVERIAGLHVGNGAALVINPQTGEILAMVGSKDYFDTDADGNVNVLTSLRQPGSSIKAVNYAYALSNGLTPATIIDDSPITFYTPGTTPYTPVNYDGQFRGLITLRSALAQSRNVPAVKVLASYGVAKMVTEGQKMGITTWTNPQDFGLSLTLGGGAVKALDLARVYATLANSGKTSVLMPILEVKNYEGQVLEKNTPESSQSIDPRVAFILTDILKDNNARAPEFGFNSYLVIKDHPEVAVKTGTSNDLRDNWTVGYNQNYLVLTWVGNNDNSPMSRIASGITGASPIWNKIMSAILNGQPSIDWNAPQGISKVNICSITGTLPCDNCPTKQEWFLDENRPTKHCSTEQINLQGSNQGNASSILETGASTQFVR